MVESSRLAPTFLASGLAACLTYPFWRATAIAQTGCVIPPPPPPPSFLPPFLASSKTFALYQHALRPPFHGLVGVVFGMTWARAAIFWGSDALKNSLSSSFPPATPGGVRPLPVVALVSVLPPLLSSVVVQVLNMPLIRASISLQNPSFVSSRAPPIVTTWQAMLHIASGKHGVLALWHGSSAGVLKTVPKYVVAIVSCDVIASYQERSKRSERGEGGGGKRGDDDGGGGRARVADSLFKAVVAGALGGIVTNPFDVLRNEMFLQKTPLSLLGTVRALNEADGASRPARRAWETWPLRGMSKNLVSVVLPVAITIFAKDMLERVV